MEQKPVSPPEWTGLARLAGEFWQVSDAPIYDAVEQQGLAEGREVPRRPGLSFGGLRPLDTAGMFRRA
ncbi:hypothetical protein ACFWBC_01950 [Streptomyces sp. NPDC059985]|uniref:hypothetical protein n=1 Tax=Streptomyces sp. NPDC059985 TaxID=3347025 RepID=UPI00368E6EEA